VNYRVRWSKAALNTLASLWLQGDSSVRQAITDATRQIDNLLGADPLLNSESRTPRKRVLFVPPLGVIFRMEEDEKTVSVLKVWLFK
jgi:ParE toxin of type II toxin-antitoxin system, parDE